MSQGLSMLFKTSVKSFFFLVVFTVTAIFLHRFNYLDTSLSIPYDDSHNYSVLPVSAGETTGTLIQKQNEINMHCVLKEVKSFNLCGVGIDFSNGSIESGIDVGRYNRLDIDIAYNTPLNDPKIKVSFRNYHPNYVNDDDLASLKFNTISFNPSNYQGTTTVPLDAFQVENWWIEQYKVDFKDSQIDFSNVSRLEILSHSMPIPGVYNISIKKLILKGEIISENGLFKLIFSIWMAVGALLLLKQHNRLKKISNTDVLTGLYNRRGIQRAIHKIPFKNEVCMFYMDINEFKKINDTYGHVIGDELLIYLSRFIENKLKPFKGSYYLSRFSGDEFIILLRNISQEDMYALARSITSELKNPISVSSYRLSISVSLGIAKIQQTNNSFDILLGRADAAMYHVKNNKLDSFQEFDQSISDNIYFKKRISEFVKEAIIEGDFYLNYMPIYETKSLEMIAFEVLIRASSNNMKGIGPDVFIPIAEEYNLIQSLDLWVIENVFKKIKEDFYFLNTNPTVFCINISSEELKNPFFSENLKQLLDKYEVPPKWIKLELTETSLVKTDQTSIDMLKSVRALGVKLSLDDFGTGYISFNQLVNYPVNTLKIDKSFIDPLGTQNKPSEMLIQAILSMADSYQLDTVAEGVETPQQYLYLLDAGCDAVQGYLFSKPVSWAFVKKLLAEPNAESLKRIAMLP